MLCANCGAAVSDDMVLYTEHGAKLEHEDFAGQPGMSAGSVAFQPAAGQSGHMQAGMTMPAS